MTAGSAQTSGALRADVSSVSEPCAETALQDGGPCSSPDTKSIQPHCYEQKKTSGTLPMFEVKEPDKPFRP
jgi:hypothetical protein